MVSPPLIDGGYRLRHFDGLSAGSEPAEGGRGFFHREPRTFGLAFVGFQNNGYA